MKFSVDIISPGRTLVMVTVEVEDFGQLLSLLRVGPSVSITYDYNNEILRAVVEGNIRFNNKLNKDGFQAKIDKALQEANDSQVPWFSHEFVMEVAREELEGIAQCRAEDALYSEPTEYVVDGIL